MNKSRRAHPEVLGEAPEADHEPPRIAGRSLPVAPASRSRRPKSGKRIRLCPSCNAVALPIARFCPHCAASLRVKFPTAMRPLDQTATTVERRPLTAVFCDLVGSSELATRMDPEDYAGVLRQFHLRVRETMEQYGGFLARPMGDGALVFFGFPRANDHDLEHAVRASLATLDAVRKIDGAGCPSPRACYR
jgi:hypothetical protein